MGVEQVFVYTFSTSLEALGGECVTNHDAPEVAPSYGETSTWWATAREDEAPDARNAM